VIARVRIAPVEQWCSTYLELLACEPSYRKLVGKEVEIETSTVYRAENHKEQCRKWAITLESAKQLRLTCGFGDIADLPVTQEALCEHMLEMD